VLSAAHAIFLRTIGLHMQAGTLMPETMQIATVTAPNLAIRERIVSTIQNIENNQPYIEALVAKEFLRLGEVTTVQTAERHRELSTTMLSFAVDRDREAAADAKRLRAVMDTAVVGLLGLAIISVVLTLYVPVFIAH
jgi:type II secretory pathway component PulF